uniref:ALF2 n=1 Tax=Procambarus clarkii TaxID=6728 RepID=A0AAU7YU76_PROCL|nr:uncharacterized protein LOC123763691 [Procambarus clarkii]
MDANIAVCAGNETRLLVYFLLIVCLAGTSAATNVLPVSDFHNAREPSVFGTPGSKSLERLIRAELLKPRVLEEEQSRSHIPSDDSSSQMSMSSIPLDSSASTPYPEYSPSQDTTDTMIGEDDVLDHDIPEEPTGDTHNESEISQDSANGSPTTIHKPESTIPTLSASLDKLDETIHNHRQEPPYRIFSIPSKPTTEISQVNQMVGNGHIPLPMVPMHHFPPQEPGTSTNHFLPQIPNNRVPPGHFTNEGSSKWNPHESHFSQEPHNAIPSNHFSSQEHMGAMPPAHSVPQTRLDTMPPSHNTFQSPWNMLPGSHHFSKEVRNDGDDCNLTKKLFNWGNFITAAVDELSARMIQNEEYVLLDHYCMYFTRPYLSRWKIRILADVWCPGWTTITGSAFSKKAANSIKLATLDFVKKVVAAGLAAEEDARFWYNNNPKFKV